MENTQSKLILRNLTPDQRKAILAGTLTVGTLLGGVALFGFRSKDVTEVKPLETTDESTTENSEVLLVDTSAKFYNENTDTLSFDASFAAARESVGPGGFFNWNGSTYNTYYKEEWDAMNPKEQGGYINDIDQSSNIEELKQQIIKLEEEQASLIEKNQELDTRVKELESNGVHEEPNEPNKVGNNFENIEGDQTQPTAESEAVVEFQNEQTEVNEGTVDPISSGESVEGANISEPTVESNGDDVLPISSTKEFEPEYDLKNSQIDIRAENGDLSDFKDEVLITDFEGDRDVELIEEVEAINVDKSAEIVDAVDIQEIEGKIDENVIEAIDIEELEILEPIEPMDFEDTQDLNAGDVTPPDLSEDIPSLF
jgi:hypothetical protein